MVTSPPSVVIIILNWNNWSDTLTCVDSCCKLLWPNIEIIVVDNGSSDGSPEILSKHFPDLHIMQTDVNLGFAGGNNIGIRHAIEQGADYVWLLNNDAVVATDALSTMVEAMQDNPHAGIAGSMIYFHDDPQRIWFAGGIWEKGRLRLRQRGAYQIDTGQFKEQCEVGSVSGCSMLVRTTVINEIGLLDESYFLYWEDTDWCARAAKYGYSVLFVPTSHVWHKVSATVAAHSEMQYYYNTRNGILFCRCHDVPSLPFFLMHAAADVFVGIFRGNGNMVIGFLRGISDFCRNIKGPREFK